MNIVFVTHDFDAGGAGRSLCVLAQRLHALGHRLEILSLMRPREDHLPWQTYRALGIPVTVLSFAWISMGYVGVPAPSQGYPPHVRQKHAAAIALARQCRADVACFNGYPSTSLAPYIPARRKVLLAREVLDTQTPLFRQTAKSLKRHIDHAVAIGPVERRQLEDLGIPCTMVFNTANVPPRFHPLPETPPLHFGCFANMYEGKGQAVLTVACAAVKEELRAARAMVHIFGKGDLKYMENLEAFIVQQDLADVVRLEGWVDNVEEIMQGMHCIVRPDLTGSPWGRDVIEAMSMGRALLATGTEDVFVKEGVTGWLVPPNDPAALALALVRLSRSPSRLFAASKAAYAFAREHFDPERNAKQIEAILALPADTPLGCPDQKGS